MGKLLQYNENYTHNCECEKVSLESYKKSLADMEVLTSDNFRKIYDFYVTHAPILNDKNQKDFMLKHLSEYEWKGNTGLEGKLKEKSNMQMCFLKSKSIDNTLEAMCLKDEVCIEHPRAVLKWDYEVSIEENGNFKTNSKETRMVCLFRHIRNSLAHGRTYVFDNEHIMLEDCDENKKITARILIKYQTLLDWIDIIKKGNPKAKKQNKKVAEEDSEKELIHN